MRKIIFVFALLCSLFSQAQPRIQFWVTNKPAIHVFAPNDLSDLAAWYKSNTGVTLSGTEVIGWADQSSNGRDLSPIFSSPNRPTVVSSALNGFPVIDADGQVGLQTASAFPDHTSTGLTVFVVGLQKVSEETDGATYHHFLGTGNGYAGTGWNINRNFNFTELQFMGTQNSDVRRVPSNDVYYTIRAKVTTAFATSLALNNGTEATGTGIANTVAPGNLRVFAGFFAENVARKRIAEIIIYLRALNSTEITQVENYLQSKYQHFAIPFMIMFGGLGRKKSRRKNKIAA